MRETGKRKIDRDSDTRNGRRQSEKQTIRNISSLRERETERQTETGRLIDNQKDTERQSGRDKHRMVIERQSEISAKAGVERVKFIFLNTISFFCAGKRYHTDLQNILLELHYLDRLVIEIRM